MARIILTLHLLCLLVCGNVAAAEVLFEVELKRVGGGFTLPVHIIGQPGNPHRLLVVEQGGKVYALESGVRSAEPFLDLTSVVVSGGEKGLLSLAFHPQFIRNGKIYVNYTAADPKLHTVISELRIDPVSGQVDAKTERQLLTIPQPFSNHNGGQIAFGPDGMLYIGMGDGGSRLDPHGHGQNLATLLGALLRIDIDKGEKYGVPDDNPFVGRKDARAEIWAYGLRNPWRFSFDRETGLLWLADVGQDRIEEIDIIKRGGNYGWNVYEGSHCLRIRIDCLRRGYEVPIAEYGRDLGQSITGGFVYRGSAFPVMRGFYFYGDYMSGRLWALRYENDTVMKNDVVLKTEIHPSSFGEGADGELYVASHQSGEIFQIVQKLPATETPLE